MKNLLVILVLAAILMTAGYYLWTGIKIIYYPEPEVGSVIRASEYTSTSTRGLVQAGALAAQGNYIIASTTPTGFASSTITTDQKFGSITLGSVIIASTSPSLVDPTNIGWMKIIDATSTSDDCGGATNTIALFQGGADEGTYTFDVSLKRGLLIQFDTGFFGDYTITWRE